LAVFCSTMWTSPPVSWLTLARNAAASRFLVVVSPVVAKPGKALRAEVRPLYV
jgi:hypothetical protein